MNQVHQHSDIWQFAVKVAAIGFLIAACGAVIFFIVGHTPESMRNIGLVVTLLWSVIHFIYLDASKTLDDCFSKLDATGYLPNLRLTVERQQKTLRFWWGSSFIAQIILGFTIAILFYTGGHGSLNLPSWLIPIQHSEYVLMAFAYLPMIFSAISVVTMLILREKIGQFRRDTEAHINSLKRRDSALKSIRESEPLDEEEEYLKTHGRLLTQRVSESETEDPII